jgi:hypothetical protein
MGAHHGDVGFGEVISCAQHGVPSSLGQGVCEAVPEVQPSRMPSFAITTPAAHRSGGQVCVYGHDIDLRVTHEAVDDILSGRPEPGLDDDAQFDADCGRHQADDGILKMAREFVGPPFTKNDCHRRRRVDDKAPAPRLRQRGRPTSS